jgi:hypothetical protein
LVGGFFEKNNQTIKDLLQKNAKKQKQKKQTGVEPISKKNKHDLLKTMVNSLYNTHAFSKKW